MVPTLHQVIHLQIRDARMLLNGVVHEKATGDAEEERNPTDDIEGQLPAKAAQITGHRVNQHGSH